MLALAVPMVLLFLAAEILARLIDRFRRTKRTETAIGDDELSPL